MNNAHKALRVLLVILPSGSVLPTDHVNLSAALRMKLATYGSSAMTPTILIDPAIIELASTAPIRNVPEPPMNAFAGYQFHLRNASRPPPSESRATADSIDP